MWPFKHKPEEIVTPTVKEWFVVLYRRIPSYYGLAGYKMDKTAVKVISVDKPSALHSKKEQCTFIASAEYGFEGHLNFKELVLPGYWKIESIEEITC